MNFCELTENEFRKFSSAHELRSFLQSPEMAEAKKEDGCDCYYVGVKQNNKVICATLLFEYKGRFFKTFTSPRGYLIDYRNIELLRFFTKEIKKFIKQKGGIYLNIEPNVLYKERDINGEIVKDGFDNSDIYNNLIKLGYRHNGFYLEMDRSKQCRWEFILNLKNKSKDKLFSNFKANTRNIIRKNIKYGVAVRELGYDELDKFHDIVESSGSRKNFHSRTLEYYQKMYNIFYDKGEVKYFVTELDIEKYISELSAEIKELEQKLLSLNGANYNKGKQTELSNQIKALKSRITIAEEWQQKYGNKPITSGAMFMLYGTEIVYLFSGTRSEFITMKTQFLLQWHMIQYAVDNGYEIYNFGGITGDLKPSNPEYGVYEFKKNFGGNVIEYIGDFDLMVSPFKCLLRKITKKIGR